MADQEDILPVTIPRFAAVRERIHEFANANKPAGGNLREREFSWKQQEDEKDRALKEHAAALHESAAYLDLANHLAKTQQEAQQNIDAADFLTKAKDIPVTDPDYEGKVASLHAQLPHAAGHPAVEDYLKTNAPARELYRRGQQSGVIPSEASTRAALAGGLLTPQDFEWADSTKRPDIYNPDGSINHEHAAWLASQRQGAQEGTKAQALKQAQNMKIIDAGLGLIKAGTLDDPENADFKTIYQSTIKEEAQRRGVTAAPSAVAATPTPAPATEISLKRGFPESVPVPAPSKPAVVIQNGHTYTLQADGSYK